VFKAFDLLIADLWRYSGYIKPEFALSLSQDGVDLLFHGPAGWDLVGRAEPEAAGFADDMTALVQAARSLTSQDLTCSLILPNEQVKYLVLETPGWDREARRDHAARTLEELTPYSADEIVFDVQLEGDTTRVAAVARDTITEAEAFATQYGFVPLAYVAQPQEGPPFAIEPVPAPSETAGGTDAANGTIKLENEAAATEIDAVDPVAEKAPAPENGPANEPEQPAPEFVSRRRVPTFQTTPGDRDSAAEIMPGFAEPETPFEAAPPSNPAPAPAAKKAAESPAPGKARARNENERMTVFGARDTSTVTRRGVGPFGVGLAAASVVALGVVAFAGSALGPNLGSFFALLNAPKPTAQFTAPLQPPSPNGTAAIETEDAQVEQVSLTGTLTDEDNAVLDALRAPVLDPPTPRSDRTQDELRAGYAVTGIWPLAPEVPSPPPLVDLDNLYETSIDPIEMNFDAVALPALKSLIEDTPFLGLAAPAPAGTEFTLDSRGFVIPTPEGALNPDGIRIFAGAPPVRQPGNLLRIEDPGEDLAQRLRLSAFRPNARPSNLIETNERAALGGLTRSELGDMRPRLRPASAQETAQAASASAAAASLVPQQSASAQALVQIEEEENLLATATARAVPVSLRPDARPLNFAAVVERARATAAPAAPTQVASAAPVAPRVVTPTIPSSASAAREATVRNAINLRQVNLIGVYGKPSSRRALVRLGNGSYRKVEVGDRIDGGRVSAIGDAELRYQKSGRDIVLKMPRG
jgi:hypothetical protein